MNVDKGVYFLDFTIKNFRGFGEEQKLDLSDKKRNWRKWTVLLGDNGTGKTSLLQLLATLETIKVKLDKGQDSVRPVGLWTYIELKASPDKEPGYFKANAKYYSQNPIKTLSEKLQFGLKENQLSQIHHCVHMEMENLKCYGYGANRFMSTSSLSESKSKNSETLFNDDAKLINAEEWLLQLDYASSKESEVQQYAAKKRDQVKEILLNLLPDIKELRFTTPTKENLKSTVEFATPYGWVAIHQLSLGYKTMVAWVVDLAARMFERYPDSENPLAEPAIVLVDEIDLHLHPKWQRKIFDYLDERFPKTQFIVTAHSPLVVQSAPKDANIVLLKREGNHVVITQDTESVKNWRLDQILTSDLFGIESARSPEIEKEMTERTLLLQKNGKLTPEESARLKELNNIAHGLPTADRKEDIEAMEIIRKAAEIIKNK